MTAQIVNAIEQGVGNWRMPWHTSGKFAFSPINVATQKPYSGVNTVCALGRGAIQRLQRGEWATYPQWQERGGQVRKGEKGCVRGVLEVRRRAQPKPGGEERDTASAARICCYVDYTAYSMRRRWTGTLPKARRGSAR